MNITITSTPHNRHKLDIFRLWNNEYPAQLGFADMAALDVYLNNLGNPIHYFATNDNNSIIGWAFTFEREGETWFAIIVDSTMQGKGVGSQLLHSLKANTSLLNGWVTDHYRYSKQNGQPYLSPFQFYLKNGFTVCHEIRLEIPVLSAVKITWQADEPGRTPSI